MEDKYLTIQQLHIATGFPSSTLQDFANRKILQRHSTNHNTYNATAFLQFLNSNAIISTASE